MAVSSHVPRIIPPTWPDFHRCSYFHGWDLDPRDCLEVINQHIGWVDHPVEYYLAPPPPNVVNTRPADSKQLPFREQIGSCTVSIQIAGPYLGSLPGGEHIAVVPSFLAGLAAYLLQQCPERGAGIGGYMTRGLGTLFDLIDQNIDELRQGEDIDIGRNFRRRNPTHFLTIELGNDHPNRQRAEQEAGTADPVAAKPQQEGWQVTGGSINSLGPGDTDPEVPEALEMHAADMYNRATTAANREYFARLAQGFHDQSLRMARADHEIAWWDESLTFAPYDPAHHADELGTVDMSYDCDANMGIPDAADCEKLLFEHLGNLHFKQKNGQHEPVITIGGGAPSSTFEGSCALSLSATRITTITYEQVRAAVEALTNYCVSNPWKGAAGGRAYKGKQRISSWFDRYINWAPPVNGRTVGTKARRKRQASAADEIDGGNALPANVQIYMYRHEEGAPLGCELGKVLRKEKVEGCGRGKR